MIWVAVIVGFIAGVAFGMVLLAVLTGEKAAEEYKRGYEDGRQAECMWCPFSYTAKDEWGNIVYKCPIKYRGAGCPAKVVSK